MGGLKGRIWAESECCDSGTSTCVRCMLVQPAHVDLSLFATRPQHPHSGSFPWGCLSFSYVTLVFLQWLPPPTRRKLDLDLVLYFHLTFHLSNPLSTLSSPVSRWRVAVSLTAFLTEHGCLHVLGKLSRCKPLWCLKARIRLLNFGFLF